MISPEYYIRTLDLQPHPEGGWYREIYRASEEIPQAGLPERYGGARPFSTAIYFLLTADSFSALHRIKSDEQWHFYAGSPLIVHVIDPAGGYQALRLGSDLDVGETFHAVVSAGSWFGATVDAPQGFALVGCTVAPGFDFADFEMGKRAELAELVERYPRHRELIERLTRG